MLETTIKQRSSPGAACLKWRMNICIDCGQCFDRWIAIGLRREAALHISSTVRPIEGPMTAVETQYSPRFFGVRFSGRKHHETCRPEDRAYQSDQFAGLSYRRPHNVSINVCESTCDRQRQRNLQFLHFSAGAVKRGGRLCARRHPYVQNG